MDIFNIGDVFVILAALWLGPRAGFLVGAIGPTMADAVGYPQFMVATFVIKGLEGLVVGYIGGGFKKLPIKEKVVCCNAWWNNNSCWIFYIRSFYLPMVWTVCPIF
jgi:uncharacterized membrane protein